MAEVITFPNADFVALVNVADGNAENDDIREVVLSLEHEILELQQVVAAQAVQLMRQKGKMGVLRRLARAAGFSRRRPEKEYPCMNCMLKAAV